MSYELIKAILDELGIVYTYYEFKEPVSAARYIAYYENGKDTFLADDKVYAYEPRFTIELYTKVKEPAVEQQLIDILASHDVAWSADPTTYIDSEKVYLTVFYV